jgi:hypothetical protein
LISTPNVTLSLPKGERSRQGRVVARNKKSNPNVTLSLSKGERSREEASSRATK